MNSILERFYGFDIPQAKRTRPLQVICVGPPRSGTESLRLALLELGYSRVWHGFDVLLPGHEGDWACLTRLAKKKYGRHVADGDKKFTATDFDTLVADCDCVTDVASSMFAAEMIEAYPDAKVILNYRRNIDKW